MSTFASYGEGQSPVTAEGPAYQTGEAPGLSFETHVSQSLYCFTLNSSLYFFHLDRIVTVVMTGEGAIDDDDESPPATSKPKFCHECGTKWQTNHKFCSECGTKKTSVIFDEKTTEESPSNIDNHSNKNDDNTKSVLIHGLFAKKHPPQKKEAYVQYDTDVPITSGRGYIISSKLLIHFDDEKPIPDFIRDELPPLLEEKGISMEEWQTWMDRITDINMSNPENKQCLMNVLFILMIFTIIGVFIYILCGSCLKHCCCNWWNEKVVSLKHDINQRLNPNGMFFGMIRMKYVEKSHRNFSGTKHNQNAPCLLFTLTEYETLRWESGHSEGLWDYPR